MAKKRKMRRLTAEEEARFDETRRMVDERIAYHTAKAEEQERARAEAEKR